MDLINVERRCCLRKNHFSVFRNRENHFLFDKSGKNNLFRAEADLSNLLILLNVMNCQTVLVFDKQVGQRGVTHKFFYGRLFLLLKRGVPLYQK